MRGAARAVALLAALATIEAAASRPVARVTPSGNCVPENLLRIELRLARPLPRPLAMDHVRMLDASGAPIAGAMLDLPLPGDDGRTITLLLHPGRVKSGVGANLALGRAIQAGKDVTLVVDDPQLHNPLRKHWHVGPAARNGLLAGAWRFEPPRVGSRAPLRVIVDSPLTASSAALIAVRSPDGARVAGTASLESGETVWRFRPNKPWRAGTHALVVHPLLEDVAGNRPCAPFEMTGLSEQDCRIAERPFDVRP